MTLKTAVRRVVYVLVGCLSAFVAAELLLRLVYTFTLDPKVLLYGVAETPHDEYFDPKGAVRRYDQRYVTTAFHENVFDNYSKYFPNQRRIHPDQDGKPIPATINASGFRGPPFETQKSPNVIRIVTLGASATFGFRNQDNETFPYNLEVFLNDGTKSPDAKKYEVYNLAIPHLQSDEIASLFQAEALQYHPDIVLFYEGFTDAAGAPRDAGIKAGVKRLPLVTNIFRELRQRSLVVAAFGKMTSQKYSTVPDKAADTSWEKEADEKKARFIASLGKMNELCRSNKITFVVISQQSASLTFPKDKIKGVSYRQELDTIERRVAQSGEFIGLQKTFLIHHALMDAEEKWAQSQGVRFIDAITATDAHRDLLIDWMHWTPAGNRLLAEVIKKELEAR